MKRRARSLEKALARKGRFGDTEIAHVNPREKALLMALGGAGTRNPKTGFPEFYDASFDGGDVGSGQTGGNIGGGGTDSPGGGGGYTSPGEVDQELANETSKGVTNPDYSTGGLSAPPTPGITERLSGWVKSQVDPRTPQGMFNSLTGLAPGFGMGTRAARGLAEALGDYVGKPLNDMFGGSAKAIDFDFGNSGRFGGSFPDSFGGIDMGPEGRNGPLGDVLAQALDVTPVAAPMFAPTNPGDVPQEISSFMGPGMTDLQRRALISTYGTQGLNSAFRSDPVKKYYANLLRNGIIEQNGRLAQQPYTLPIEHLYWQGVLGDPVADTNNAEQIMAVASRYL